MVSAQWHLNPSPQRWSSAYPSAQRLSWSSPLWDSYSVSFFPSSFMSAHWLPIAPLSRMGPGRIATIWGFWKAPPLAKAVTMSLRTTPVISKFRLLTETVTTNMYHFSSSVQLVGTMGLVNSTTDVVVEAVWVEASIGLASWTIGQSSIWSLVEETVVSPFSGRDPNDEGAVPCISQTPAEFDSVLLVPLMVGWGHQLIVPGLILPKPWITSCLEKMTCSFPLSLSSRTLLDKGQKSRSTGRLNLSTQYCNPWA